MPEYITALAALCVPQPGRIKPFWHSLQAPSSSWTVAGRNFPDTNWFFGDRELVDVSHYFNRAKITSDIVICASYERAVFDMLHYYIEVKRVPVPNVQAFDIDDVVEFTAIKLWIKELEQKCFLRRADEMFSWLNEEGY